jgi:asparagine synthase (glutamine-hydrolysing)
MSSLFGFYNLSGRPLEGRILNRAQIAMQNRGARFTDSYILDALGLGFSANHPSEGSLYHHRETSIVAAADARLDNKQDLTEALALRSNTSIAEIIVRAYLKWGQDCPSHLKGDFAFVIWDPRKNQLLCARDHLGLKQLLYHFTANKVFGCASDAKTLFAHEGIHRRMSEARLLDFFVQSLEGIDKSCTAFEGVNRLPPGHSLILKNGHVSLSKYWTLEPKPPSKLKTQSAFIEAFNAHLQTAVMRRFDSTETTGMMVSGGMDSSAAAALAVQKIGSDIKAFSAINSADPNCIETRMIRQVNSHLGITAKYVDLAKPAQWLGDARSGLAEISDPFDSNMNMMRGICGAAKREKMTVLMDGAWGDTVFAPGSHVRRLIRDGRFFAARKALNADRDYHGETTPSLPKYIILLGSTFIPSALKTCIFPIRNQLRTNQFIKSLKLDDGFANRNKLAERLKKYYSHINYKTWHNLHDEAAEIIHHPNFTVARERYDRVAGHFGLIMRDPYTDIDLVKFCLSLPIDQRTAEGIPKLLLRRAMSDFLPAPVTSRLSKEHLGFKFSNGVYVAGKKAFTKYDQDLISKYTTVNLPLSAMTDSQKHDLFYSMNWIGLFESSPAYRKV